MFRRSFADLALAGLVLVATGATGCIYDRDVDAPEANCVDCPEGSRLARGASLEYLARWKASCEEFVGPGGAEGTMPSTTCEYEPFSYEVECPGIDCETEPAEPDDLDHELEQRFRVTPTEAGDTTIAPRLRHRDTGETGRPTSKEYEVRRAVLLYLECEPDRWGDEWAFDCDDRRAEISGHEEVDIGITGIGPSGEPVAVRPSVEASGEHAVTCEFQADDNFEYPDLVYQCELHAETGEEVDVTVETDEVTRRLTLEFVK